MGFGTFFIGYFLLLNIAYYSLTDVIAVAVMLLGLAKLSRFNRGFRAAFICAGIFLPFSLVEFGFSAYEMLFSTTTSEFLISYFAILRHLIICLIAFTSLEGMRDVSFEVGLVYHSKRCRISSYLALPIYILAIIAETPALFTWPSALISTIIGVISMVATLIYTIFNLVTIYTCYAKICMPEDIDNEIKKPDGKNQTDSSFLSSFKNQKQEREKEYAEYRLSRIKERNKKRKK